MNPAGEAAATWRPAAKAGAPAHRCGASLQIEGAGNGGDPHRLGDAAADREIRLEDVDRAQHREVAEIVAGELALAGGDRDVGRGAHLGPARLVVGGHRLLEPGEVAVLDEAAEALRLGDRKGAVRVAHQPDLGAQRLARRDARGAPSGAGRRR